MFRHTLRSLWSHKRRLISTCIAVILGVAFMAGTLVLSATINQRVRRPVRATSARTSTPSSAARSCSSPTSAAPQRALLDESVVAKVAAGRRRRRGRGVDRRPSSSPLLDNKGDPMGGVGPPTIVGSWDTDEAMSSYQIDRGPGADRGRARSSSTAPASRTASSTIGDDVTLITPKGREELELVGTSKFGDADSAGGSIFVGTTLEQAQTLAGEPGKVDTIYVRADEGVTPEQLVAVARGRRRGPQGRRRHRRGGLRGAGQRRQGGLQLLLRRSC